MFRTGVPSALLRAAVVAAGIGVPAGWSASMTVP
jgi:hypothetical protein